MSTPKISAQTQCPTTLSVNKRLVSNVIKTGLLEVEHMWSLLNSTFSSDWPEIEYLPSTAYTNGTSYGFIRSALVAPLSRGSISLRSPNAWDLPVFDPGFLTSPADRERAVQAFKRLRSIWQGLVDAGVADPVEATPGPSVQTDAQILQYIQGVVSPVWHAACTCKMGQSNDTTAVVDSNAAVFGTQGLRIVDASAFPLLPPGHPTSTVYAFAEKIADVIIRERGSNSTQTSGVYGRKS